MLVYIEVTLQYPESCATCGKELSRGEKAYIQVDVHYREPLEAFETATCKECKKRKLRET